MTGAVRASFPRVTTDGSVNAAAVLWRVGARTRITVVVKSCLEYDASGSARLIQPLPIFVGDRYGADGVLTATSDIAPFIPSPELMIIGRAPHPVGRARVGFRVERGDRTLLDKHVDVDAGAVVPLGPQPSQWPVAPEAFEGGIVALPSADGGPFQRAPADQRAIDLRGTEEVVLIGLYPGAPFFRFELMEPWVEAKVLCAGFEDFVPICIDTVMVTLAERRCTLLYRGSIPLRSENDLGDIEVKVSARPDPRTVSASGQILAPPAAAPAPVAKVGTLTTEELERARAAMSTLALTPPKTGPLPFMGPPSVGARGPSSSNTPWSEEPTHDIAPASAASATLPLDGAHASAVEAARAALAARRAAAAAVEEAPAAAPPKSTNGPAASPWREDPAPAPAPAPQVPIKAPKKDLNAKLYKRPKPTR